MSTARPEPASPSPAPVAWTGGELLFGLAFPSLLTLLYFVALDGAPRLAQQGVYALGKALQFGLPLLWLVRRAPRPWRPGWPSGRGALLGTAFGLVALAGGLALYHGVLVPHRVLDGAPAAAIRAKVAGLGVAGPWRFLALGAFYSLVHSAAEELYWRGFVLGALRRRCRPTPAVLWSGAGFAAHHVVLLLVFFGPSSPWTWGLSLAVAAGGAFWAWLYLRSGSLLGPWLGHLLVDAAIFLIGWDLVR